jgi:hypothetical protein
MSRSWLSDWEPEELVVFTQDHRLRIKRERCSTCIFRPGNLMELREGRLQDMTDATDATDSNVICHQTIATEAGALCAGSVERRAGQQVRIFGRLNSIELVE